MHRAFVRHPLLTFKRLDGNTITERVLCKFAPLRDSDAIVTTGYKASTSWTQKMVANLISGEQ